MKKTMRWIAAGLLAWAAVDNGIGQTFGTSGLVHNGALTINSGDISSLGSLTDAQLAAFLDLLNGVPTFAATDLPGGGTFGTFWSLQNPTGPPVPGDTIGVDVWLMSDGTYLLNDVNVNYNDPFLLSSGNGRMRAMDDSPPSPGGGGDGSDTNAPPELNYYPPDYSTNLWIAETAVASGYLNAIGSNTTSDIQYEIQSRTNLAQNDWQSEGFVLGSELTNWTPLSVPQDNRTNLFIRLKSWASSDGSGLPDWWEWLYFGTKGVDPYGNPKGDGWNNLQKFQNGMDPNVFYTPAAPQNVAANYNPVTGLARISWQPAFGQVAGYTVHKYDWNANITIDTNLPADVTSFPDDLSADPPDDFWGEPMLWVYYSVKANYGLHGSSAWSPTVEVEPYTLGYSGNLLSIYLLSDGQGTPLLAVSALPPGSTALRLKRVDFVSAFNYQDSSNDAYYTIPLQSSINGLYPIPAAWLAMGNEPYGYPDYYWWVQTVDANTNATSGFQWIGIVSGYQIPDDSLVPPVFAGQVQLKQNLIFQLRAATVNGPLTVQEFETNNIYAVYPTLTNTAGYACSSFYSFQTYDLGSSITAYQPVVDTLTLFMNNYLYRNLVYNSADIDSSGKLTTGVDYPKESLGHPTAIQLPGKYHFEIPTTNQTPIPAMLPANNTQWFHVTPFGDSEWFDNMGLTYSWDTSTYLSTYALPSNDRNWFGLPIVSFKAFYTDPINSGQDTAVITAGNSIVTSDHPPTVYFETAQPQFQTVEYDFWQAQSYPNLDGNGNLLAGNVPMPGMPYFATTNASQKMFMAVGSQLQIAGYAKLAVQNGYAGVYGYLGQYFDHAYKMTNGVASATTTGVLSPYGQFFATEPGPAALVTMPDIDPPYQRGTCMVYCVSLQLDKNHDGNMDLSFNGADATSLASPMVFWINNDCDWTDRGYDPIGHDVPVAGLTQTADFQNNNISCPRDLEDYARLWLCGLPALTNGNYQVTLSWANVGTGTPAIKLFRAVETNGGTAYLTDQNVAIAQSAAGSTALTAPCWTLGEISPSQSYTFPANYFTSAANKYFLFEGSGIGSGELTLTISQHGTTLAQTGVWLDLRDVEDLYEEARATNVTTGLPPSSLVSQYTILHTTSALSDETKQVILHIHGMNVSDTQWKVEHTTIFKRLYWSGYHGRFASFKWPCAYLPFENNINPFNYNVSEFYAWKSAAALKNYLCYLTNRADLAGYSLNILAHSQGNIVTGEAIKQGAPFHNYILTQAAAPAHCYDTSTNLTFLQNLLDADAATHTPLYPTNGGYHGYFTNLNAHGGRLINFFNTNDFALVSGVYFGHQANWMADQETQKPEDFSWRLGQEYHYYSASGASVAYYLIDQYTVTDLAEIRGLVARSRSAPVGGQDGLGGAIGSSVDLLTGFGFGDARSEHSAQIARPIQTVWGYYDQVLRSFQIQPISR